MKQFNPPESTASILKYSGKQTSEKYEMQSESLYTIRMYHIMSFRHSDYMYKTNIYCFVNDFFFQFISMTHQSTTIESEFFWCYLNSDVTINKKFKLKKVDKNQIITRSEFWCIYLKLIMMRTQLLCSQTKGSWALLLSIEEEVIVIPKRKKLKVTIGSIAVKCKKILHFEM